MARNAKIIKENKRKRLADKFEPRRAELRKKQKTTEDFDEQQAVSAQMQALPRDASASRGVIRCRACGRPKGVYRKFGLCRIHLREFWAVGGIPGLKKAGKEHIMPADPLSLIIKKALTRPNTLWRANA